MEPRRRRISLWLLLLVVMGVAGGGYEAVQYARLTPQERNEREARSVLRRLEAAQRECIRTERAPYVRDVVGLHSPRGLVPAQIAAADGGRASGQPYHGYLFSAVPVPPEGIEGKKGRYAFLAYPVSADAEAKAIYLVDGHALITLTAADTWPPDSVLQERYAKVD